MRVMDSRIAAEPPVWRHHVCGVSRDEDAAIPQSLRHVRSRSPPGMALYSDCQVRLARAGTNQLHEPPLTHIGGRVRCRLRIDGGITECIHGEETGRAFAVHAEESRERGVVHVDDAPRLIAKPWREIRGEVNGD